MPITLIPDASTKPRRVEELLLAINASGMSQKEVCDKAEIHGSVLSRVLNRFQLLSAEAAQRLADTLGVPLDNLGPIVRK